MPEPAPFNDYYAILGISWQATAAEIKKAYREQARKVHPDVKPDDPHAAERFKRLNEAYQTLINPQKRATYDQQLRQVTVSQTYPRSTNYPPDQSTEPQTARPEAQNPSARQITRIIFAMFGITLLLIIGQVILILNYSDDTARSGGANRPSFPTLAPITPFTTPVPHLERQQIPPLDEEQIDPSTLFCTLSLDSGQHSCGDLPEITIVNGPSDGMVVLRLVLDPRETSYRRAIFEVHYAATTPTGWTVNIGDSTSNNGNGGDAGHQSNDAEVVIHDNILRLYTNQAQDNDLLIAIPGAVNADGTIYLEVSDQRIAWHLPGSSEEILSQHLFALGGQADSEGDPNFEIYAAFNRTIRVGPAHTGQGVDRVTVWLTR
ncbi:MAG: J domain-containing protein [Chloroflexi bacterium]|nr:J domain-containing protein [Chloroflexota bacterium]